MLSSDDIRKKYIEFFVKNGHAHIEASGLLPQGDGSLLFVNSGMFPLVPYLLGADHPAGKRLVDFQRSFRTDDIEEVWDHRHTTSFEMLGNRSLGDYFKEEQLSLRYGFLFDELWLDPTKIYQTVFGGSDEVPADDDAVRFLQDEFQKRWIIAELWAKTLGKGEDGPWVECDFSKQRIFQYWADKNRRQRGKVVGEIGGPDTETFYDTWKPHNPAFWQYCHPNCDCGRFIEIWNSVFMQYRLTESGRAKLDRHNVDFGWGLERITMAVQMHQLVEKYGENARGNVFYTDVFQAYIQVLEKKYNVLYADHAKDIEVIVDHIRAITWLVMDGCLPSNKDQWYFLRRLIRRVASKLQLLSVPLEAATELVHAVIEKLSSTYSAMLEHKGNIIEVVEKEIKSFSQNLKKWLQFFEKTVTGKSELTVDDAFLLQTSYGFPIELIQEICTERNINLDIAGYRAKIEEHKNISRQWMEKKFKSWLGDHSEATVRYHTATHLLHQALRELLWDHVQQKWSNLTAERLRFDFVNPTALSKEQITAVEARVNEMIQHGFSVQTETLSTEKAFEQWALGFFGDKYGPEVSVYTFLDNDNKVVAKEICTWPHVSSTQDFQGMKFRITSEESVSAGIRRIKAVLE
jgi:alanyl-tRNA synthetase